MCRHRLKATAFILTMAAALVSCAQTSLAIGISPGRVEIDFVPGQNSTHGLYIVGSGYENIAVSSRPSADCGLSEYIIPEQTRLSLKSGERAYFNVNVYLPPEYPRPGTHYCALVAEEVPEAGYSGVAAFSAVLMQVWIRVPYPAKYLEGKLSVPNVNLSGTADFTINLVSMGLEDVTAGGLITVTDSNGRNVSTLRTGSVLVESMKRGTLEAHWDTSGMPAGRYYAAATVEYGTEKPLSLGSGFKIGDILMRIINVTYPEDIFPDEITRLDVLVDSYWNDRIEGSYITLDVTGDGRPAGSGRSESFDLDPWESRLVPLYWDTEGLSEGTYTAEFQVHYAGRVEKGVMPLEIKQRPNPYLWLLLLALAAATALAATYAYRRKRRKKGGVYSHGKKQGA